MLYQSDGQYNKQNQYCLSLEKTISSQHSGTSQTFKTHKWKESSPTDLLGLKLL